MTTPVAISPIIADLQSLIDLSINKLPVIGIGLACFIIMFMLSGPISRVALKPISYLSESDLVRIVAQRLISFLVIILGLYIFLRLAGLTQFAIAVVSGTGVAGLIIGFAFKDIAENFISSLLLSVQKPFQIGDVVEVAGNLGVINRVTSRATTLVDFDGNHIQIPNSIIYKSIIKNLSANPKMRSHFVIGVGYDTSIAKAQDIAMAILIENSAVLNEPEPQVLLDNLGSSCANLKVYFWVDSEQNSVLKVSSLLQRVIMRALEQAGISMPDDVRERILISASPSESDTSKASDVVSDKLVASDDSVPHPPKSHLKEDQHSEGADVESDVDDIRKQAQQSRSPEQGDNIL